VISSQTLCLHVIHVMPSHTIASPTIYLVDLFLSNMTTPVLLLLLHFHVSLPAGRDRALWRVQVEGVSVCIFNLCARNVTGSFGNSALSQGRP